MKYSGSFFLIIFICSCGLCVASEKTTNSALSYILGKNYAAIASGYGQQITDSPGVVTVITANDIKKMGATNLEQVLTTVPGFHITNTRGIRNNYAVRGIYSEGNNDFLIKIDNIAIRDPITASRPLTFSMPVRNISRIEIIRGPGSVIHGSDAIAGVVNIITKTGKEMITDVSTQSGGSLLTYGGTFDTVGGSIQYGGQANDVEYAFSFQADTTQGSKRTIERDGVTVIDELLGTSISLAPGPITMAKTQYHGHIDLGYKDNLRMRLGVRAIEDVETGVVSLSLAPNNSITDRWVNADIEYTGNLGEFIDTTSVLSYQAKSHSSLFQHLPPGSLLLPNGAKQRFSYFLHQVKTQFITNSSYFSNHKIQFGVGFNFDVVSDIKNKQDFFNSNNLTLPLPAFSELKTIQRDRRIEHQRRFQFYGMFQDNWRLTPDWNITTGLRIDSYSDENTVFSPRFAIVHHILPTVTGKLVFNRSFHMPSFFEQSQAKKIKPEFINMLELSFDIVDLSKTDFQFSWYGYKINNLITTTDATISNVQFDNIDFEGTGGEVTLKRKFFDNVNTKLSYSLQWTKEDNTDSDYGFTPNHMVFAEINWELSPTWHVNSQIKWISKRRRQSTDSRSPLNGYTLGNVNLSKYFQINKSRNFRISLRVDNIFDVDVREPSPSAQLLPNDIPLAGRSFMGILELDL